VPELLALITLPLLVGAGLAWMITREDVRLRRRARRYRQLELEGIEELRRDDDPYPEQGRVEGGFLREPDGRAADTARVMREELERAREHTRRRGRGTACLL
jgi:hypothetical protein